jgi:hypothetical protein
MRRSLTSSPYGTVADIYNVARISPGASMHPLDTWLRNFAYELTEGFGVLNARHPSFLALSRR